MAQAASSTALTADATLVENWHATLTTGDLIPDANQQLTIAESERRHALGNGEVWRYVEDANTCTPARCRTFAGGRRHSVVRFPPPSVSGAVRCFGNQTKADVEAILAAPDPTLHRVLEHSEGEEEEVDLEEDQRTPTGPPRSDRLPAGTPVDTNPVLVDLGASGRHDHDTNGRQSDSRDSDEQFVDTETDLARLRTNLAAHDLAIAQNARLLRQQSATLAQQATQLTQQGTQLTQVQQQVQTSTQQLQQQMQQDNQQMKQQIQQQLQTQSQQQAQGIQNLTDLIRNTVTAAPPPTMPNTSVRPPTVSNNGTAATTSNGVGTNISTPGGMTPTTSTTTTSQHGYAGFGTNTTTNGHSTRTTTNGLHTTPPIGAGLALATTLHELDEARLTALRLIGARGLVPPR